MTLRPTRKQRITRLGPAERLIARKIISRTRSMGSRIVAEESGIPKATVQNWFYLHTDPSNKYFPLLVQWALAKGHIDSKTIESVRIGVNSL